MSSSSYADVFTRLPIFWQNNKTQLAQVRDTWIACNPNWKPMKWDINNRSWRNIKFQPEPFKLEHDLRNFDLCLMGGPAREMMMAIQEIQEWIHAQENK